MGQGTLPRAAEVRVRSLKICEGHGSLGRRAYAAVTVLLLAALVALGLHDPSMGFWVAVGAIFLFVTLTDKKGS